MLNDSFIANFLTKSLPYPSPAPHFIAEPIVKLFDMTSKVLPSDLKLTYIKPIFKEGQKNLASNYYPINFTLVLHKILDIIINDYHLDTTSRAAIKSLKLSEGP